LRIESLRLVEEVTFRIVFAAGGADSTDRIVVTTELDLWRRLSGDVPIEHFHPPVGGLAQDPGRPHVVGMPARYGQQPLLDIPGRARIIDRLRVADL